MSNFKHLTREERILSSRGAAPVFLNDIFKGYVAQNHDLLFDSNSLQQPVPFSANE